MCLSTAYYNSKSDDQIAARYVDKIKVDGNTVVLTDVMGMELKVPGTLSYVDLTGGIVVIDTEG